jgi:hypothetical protein
MKSESYNIQNSSLNKFSSIEYKGTTKCAVKDRFTGALNISNMTFKIKIYNTPFAFPFNSFKQRNRKNITIFSYKKKSILVKKK